ncbi:FxLYD domain-containing protein [Natrialbaceae archaeon A-arb3/5]
MTESPRTSRRRALALLGAGSTAALAGCNALGGNNAPRYETGTVGEVDGDERSADEMASAAALADQEANESVTPLDSLSLVDHEFVHEDDFRGPTVQGTIENEGDDRVQLVEVRVRVYDDADDQLGRFLDSTGDLDSGERWAFEVILFASPDEIATYDITVLGVPT